MAINSMTAEEHCPNSPTDMCPCGSGASFKKCCSPLLEGRIHAATPEQLMRSRYTAYVQKNSRYLLQTWDFSCRPASLSLENDHTIWLGLEIHEAPLPEQEASAGSVDFTAISAQKGKKLIMREASRFVKRDGCWLYLDGDLRVTEIPLSLKGPCPCGSGKKFKRCCAEAKKRGR